MNAIEIWNRFARERREAGIAEGDYWLSKAKDYSRQLDQRWAEGSDETREYLARLCADDSIQTVLDLGAGTGQWSLYFARMGRNVTALEPSAGMRAVMAENIASDPRTSERINVIEGRWPETDAGTFDVSFCSHAMYEWDDLAASIEALCARTRRRVVLAIRAPYGDDFYARLAAVLCPEAPYSGTDFPLLYAALMQMGIYADVTFESRDTAHVRKFNSVEDAVSIIAARFGADSGVIRELILSEGYTEPDGRVRIPMRGKTACVSFRPERLRPLQG